MTEALTTAITAVINAVTTTWGSIVTNESILPYFIIGIAVSIVLVGIKVVRSVVWGA